MSVLFLILAASVSQAYGAPCCAGSSAAPAMISGDDKTQLSFSTSHGTVIGDAPSQGIPVFRAAQNRETLDTFRIDGATLISDRLQIGASTPFHHRKQPQRTASGMGDVRLNIAYEVFQEWSYSLLNPKGYHFLQLTLPTGKSIYETETTGAIDAFGQGAWTLSNGLLLVKRGSTWDALMLPQIQYAWGRRFELTQNDWIESSGSWGASLTLGLGYSLQKLPLRLGLSLQPNYRQQKAVRTPLGESLTSFQQSWDTTIDASYLHSNEWSANLSYTDQTLLGPATNVALSRTLAVSVRWGLPR